VRCYTTPVIPTTPQIFIGAGAGSAAPQSLFPSLHGVQQKIGQEYVHGTLKIEPATFSEDEDEGEDEDDDDDDPRNEISLEALEILFAPYSVLFAKLQRDPQEAK
jgi:hypothetical protein